MREEDQTKEKLVDQLAELRQRIAELEAIKNKHKQAEEALQEYTHDLGERVKELNCLYGISKILEKPDISLEDILQGTADLIPPAWQYPDITCARVILEDQEFRTEKFKKTIWKQACDIVVHGNRIGTLEVCYLEERRKSDEGPFLKEERSLINAIAERLGRITERKRAVDALEKYTHDLGERVKELNCLYGISKILEKPDISLEKILQGIVDIIPPSWQYPEITCARITLEGQGFRTKNLRETIWKQASDIIVDGDRLGTLEVFYLEEKPDCYEGPFLKEERLLINAVTERLGRIIERKRAEAALRESQEQLHQAQKMKALGTLVAGVAHEINNPINLIMFNIPLFQKIWHDFSPVLKEHARKESDRKYGGLTYDFLKDNLNTLLSDMDIAANRVARIVTNLKNFAKQSNVADKKPVQLNTAVENAMRLAQTTLRKSGIDLRVDLADNLPLMEGSLQSIEQIILNITINAIQAIENGQGRVELLTGFQEEDGRVFLSISDNGRGIDPSVSDKIFDPFVTNKQTEDSTGLGLSITYNLVKAHKGEITFQSQNGKGTTFTVYFPAKLKGESAGILVADDDRSVRDVIVNSPYEGSVLLGR